MFRIGPSFGQQFGQTLVAKSILAPKSRAYVNQAVLNALIQSPLAEVVKDNFKFQKHGECVSNSMEIRGAIEKRFVDRNLIEQQAATLKKAKEIANFESSSTAKMSTWDPRLDIQENPTGDQIAELNKKHGPVVLIMQNAVGWDQGAHVYKQHHALTLVGSFKSHLGNNIGIVIDGNDLQQNAGVQKALEYTAKKYGSGSHHDLSKLTRDDMAKLSAETNGEFDKLRYTLVDLDTMAATSNQKLDVLYEVQRENHGLTDMPVHANQVRYNPRNSPSENLLPIAVENELKALIKEDQSIVESFPRAPEEAREHTETHKLWDERQVSTSSRLTALQDALNKSKGEPYTWVEWEKESAKNANVSATSSNEDSGKPFSSVEELTGQLKAKPSETLSVPNGVENLKFISAKDITLDGKPIQADVVYSVADVKRMVYHGSGDKSLPYVASGPSKKE